MDAQRAQVQRGERIRVAAIDRRIAGLQPELAAIGELPEPIQADRVAIGAGLVHDEAEAGRVAAEDGRVDQPVDAVGIAAGGRQRIGPADVRIVGHVGVGGIHLPDVQAEVGIGGVGALVVNLHRAAGRGRLGCGHRRENRAGVLGVADIEVRCGPRCRQRLGAFVGGLRERIGCRAAAAPSAGRQQRGQCDRTASQKAVDEAHRGLLPGRAGGWGGRCYGVKLQDITRANPQI